MKLTIIKLAVNIWDPINLFPFSPSDEYGLEINKISDFLEKKQKYDVKKTGFFIHNLFIDCFGIENYNSKLDEAEWVSKQIIEAIHELEQLKQ